MKTTKPSTFSFDYALISWVWVHSTKKIRHWNTCGGMSFQLYAVCLQTNLLHKCFLRILSIEYFYYFISAWYLVAIYFCKDLFLWERLWRVFCRYTFASKRFPKKNRGFKFANFNLARISKRCIYRMLWSSINKTLLKLYLKIRKLFFS